MLEVGSCTRHHLGITKDISLFAVRRYMLCELPPVTIYDLAPTFHNTGNGFVRRGVLQ